MRKIILSAALTFVGCYQPTGYFYQSGCVAYASEVPLQQDDLDAHTEYAQAMIDANFWEGAFCDAHKDDTIEVVLKAWKCPWYTTPCAGESQTGHIKIKLSASSLLHETIHDIEGSQLRAGTAWHEGWEVKGYRFLDDFFMFNAPPLRQDFGP